MAGRLEKAAPLAEELGKLKYEKISDQETFINLQNKVIVKQEDSLRSVQNAVQTTLESHVSVVLKSCFDVFTPKRIQTIVRNVAGKEETMKYVIVYGLN